MREPTVVALRRLVLAVFFLSALGAGIELVLLEHFDGVWQIVPLALLGAAGGAGALAGLRATRRALRGFQTVMVLSIASGLAGLLLHYRGNVEFEREMYPSLAGLELFWKAVTGATPALAPGFMVQLGLLGLAYCYRHPALGRREESL